MQSNWKRLSTCKKIDSWGNISIYYAKLVGKGEHFKYLRRIQVYVCANHKSKFAQAIRMCGNVTIYCAYCNEWKWTCTNILFRIPSTSPVMQHFMMKFFLQNITYDFTHFSVSVNVKCDVRCAVLCLVMLLPHINISAPNSFHVLLTTHNFHHFSN